MERSKEWLFTILIVLIWIISICFLCYFEVSAEEISDMGVSSADADQNNNDTLEYNFWDFEGLENKVDDINSDLDDVKTNLDDVNETTKETLELTKEGNQDETQVTKDDLIIVNNNIISLHEDLQKIMVSVWALCGLYMGTKLIRGLFGYG